MMKATVKKARAEPPDHPAYLSVPPDFLILRAAPRRRICSRRQKRITSGGACFRAPLMNDMKYPVKMAMPADDIRLMLHLVEGAENLPYGVVSQIVFLDTLTE